VNDLCAVHDVATLMNKPARRSELPFRARLRAAARAEPARQRQHRSLAASIAIVRTVSTFSFSVSYGQGIRSVDPSYITQDIETPFARVVAYEGGVTYAGAIGSTQLTARSIVFQTHVDKDLIFSETAGRNVLGNGTTRTGWVGAFRLTGVHFDESLNLTLVKSIYDDTHLLVAYAPEAVLRSDSAYVTELPVHRGTLQGSLGAGISYVGPRPLPYGQRSDAIFTVDLSASLSVSHFELGIVTTNLLGTQYRLGEYNYASNFGAGGAQQPTLVPARHFTAGAPRGIFASFAVNFGGA
jgi:hypothetical protein